MKTDWLAGFANKPRSNKRSFVTIFINEAAKLELLPQVHRRFAAQMDLCYCTLI